MNIREYKESEVKRIVEIWYQGSLISHDFIDENYWGSQLKEMEENYIPMSETYVVSNEEGIVGFLSMMDNYLAALFIDVTKQGRGYGKALLDFIKKKRESIQLKVYKSNKSAVNFYLKNGFEITEELVDEPTTEKEFLMVWNKN